VAVADLAASAAEVLAAVAPAGAGEKHLLIKNSRQYFQYCRLFLFTKNTERKII
jgi:hypothetical protein